MTLRVFKQFLRFGIIGAVVFGFEAGILYGLNHYLPWSIYYCRLLSFIPAVTLAWWLNRRFTFISVKGLGWWRELLRYCMVNATGSLVNLGAFFMVLHFVERLKPFPVAALAIGSVAGMFFNFISSKLLVFYR